MKRISKHGFDSVSVLLHIMQIEKVIFKVPFFIILIIYTFIQVFSLRSSGEGRKNPEQILHVHLLTYVPSIIFFTVERMEGAMVWCGVELSHH